MSSSTLIPESNPRPQQRSAIQIRNLGMSYNGHTDANPVDVLFGIDFDVAEGEFLCIVGPSGCGKSTILNIIAGFLHASSGQVFVGGELVTGPDARRIVIFQESAVFPWMTVWENVGFGLLHLPASERQPIVQRYIDLVGLSGFERSYSRQLSGGMRQRVELARALAANTEVIYMDEPFGALDYLTRMKVRSDLIRIWFEERKTIVFVTHDIDEALQLADRIVVLSRRPATIREVVEVNLPRPREMDHPDYLISRAQIFAAMAD